MEKVDIVKNLINVYIKHVNELLISPYDPNRLCDSLEHLISKLKNIQEQCKEDIINKRFINESQLERKFN